MVYDRPIVISIAGLDPSGGAGLLADIKTLEQHRCIGFGVLSAWTVQTEDRFISAHWLSAAEIIQQLTPLFGQYNIAAVKIGIMPGLDVLQEVLTWLHQQRQDLPIVWDPVLAASAGYLFLSAIETELLPAILKQVSIITPNFPEAIALSRNDNISSAALDLSRYGTVYLKGGHDQKNVGVDYLYDHEDIVKVFASAGKLSPKHGSGCVLSAAIAAGIALGLDLITACEQAKAYAEKALNSNDQLLAYHHV